MDLVEAIPDTDALRHLDEALDAARVVADPRLLALCERRLAEMLGHDGRLAHSTHRPLDDWRDDPSLTHLERATLSFVEQYRTDVASLRDDDVAPLRNALGDDGLVDFVNAVLVVEQRMTLELTFGAVL